MTRTAVLSDAHGNLPALQAVLDDASRPPGVDEFWYLGDAVGYGPWPYQVWSELRGLPISSGAWLAGNHEWGLLSRLAGLRQVELGGKVHTLFGFYSRLAWPILDLERNVLENQTEMLHHLGCLPVMSSPRAGIYLAHGAFNVDEETSIIRYDRFPTLNAADFKRLENGVFPMNLAPGGGGQPRILAIGHTHIPGLWRWNTGKERWDDLSLNRRSELGDLEHQPLFLNPGSVGFPRDGDGCAFYALVDWAADYVELRRVWYPQEQIRKEMAKTPEYRVLLEEGFLSECQSPSEGV